MPHRQRRNERALAASLHDNYYRQLLGTDLQQAVVTVFKILKRNVLPIGPIDGEYEVPKNSFHLLARS
jgi:hypothetical protein